MTMQWRRTRIKICGIRDEATALAAVEAGADALGFVFVHKSPRFIEPRDAWRLFASLPPFVHTVGLFKDASLDDYIAAEEICPTDYGQLHGHENEELVRACGPRIIKAVRFDPATIERQLARWAAIEEVDAILVDGSEGGEGTAFDWEALAKAKQAAANKPLILAGGLTPQNVGEAIRAVRPFAVDVSSGVESAPGVKDPALIRAFCEAVRADDSAAR
ncbi:MAG: phosphoribosylanthranilate isomerase [Planctomycetota bacterium]|nr:phosphoribosylanthranilate isomerase [Planctomycetota bacterium]